MRTKRATQTERREVLSFFDDSDLVRPEGTLVYIQLPRKSHRRVPSL
jgi:hypothetical protein